MTLTSLHSGLVHGPATTATGLDVVAEVPVPEDDADDGPGRFGSVNTSLSGLELPGSETLGYKRICFVFGTFLRQLGHVRLLNET